MGFISLECQICLYRTAKLFGFRKHMQSPEHIKKMKEIFPQDVIQTISSLPYITFLKPTQREGNDPIVGVSLLTLCMFMDKGTSFYLCHSCEQTCALSKIMEHLTSEDHYCSYFNYTNPNALSFSWLSGTDVTKNLHAEVRKETNKEDQLEILHLPSNLMKKFQSSPYSGVMKTLKENEKLLKQFEAVHPKRTTIQTYQNDSNRKYPLLGLQHLVECVCVESSEKSHFLCTLCSQTVSSRVIIKHVLSFDHIFCYFKAWHPSTLLSKEYYRNCSAFFASGMLNLSKQSLQVHGAANTDVKTVSLTPEEFKLVNCSCYVAALKKLESITGSSLKTTVTPGEKLECSIITPPSESSYGFHCQLCNVGFNKVFQYVRHLSQQRHRQSLARYFGEADALHNELANFCLGLNVYIKNCLARNEPAVGAHLVVTFITTQAENDPVYLCFACQECFSQWGIDLHFQSRKHLIHTLLYQNPWRLPFGWEDDLEDADLTLRAWKEEKESQSHRMSLKIFDVPNRILQSFTPLSHSKVLEELKLYHNVLRRQVPPCKTYSKLHENKRFPLLGNKFLVRWFYDDGEVQQSGSLCLLCKRLLSDIEFYAHIFSREHVTAFLDRFHPGSLNSSTNSVEILLDLAKQAACVHPIEHVQVVMLDRLIREPCPYHTLKQILNSVKTRAGSGSIEPSISPKTKLIPRETVKEGDKNHGSDNSQKSSNTNKLCAPSGQHQDNKDAQITPTPSANKSEMKSEGCFSSDDMKNADKTCQAVKVKTGQLTVTTPSGDIPESSQSSDRDDGAEKSESSREIPAQQKDDGYKEGERKRSSSMSEVSHKTTCPDEDVREEMACKRRRLTCDEDMMRKNPSKTSNSEQKVENKADMEERQEVNKGSNTPLQCGCDQNKPNYHCEYCSLKSSVTAFISHAAGCDNQEVDMEIDDSGDSQAAIDVSTMTDTTFRTTQAAPEQKENHTTTKVPESGGSSHTSVPVPRSSGDTLNPNVSTSGKSTARLPPDSTFNDCKAHIAPKTTVASVKVTTTLKREDATAATSRLTGSTSNAAPSNTTSTTKPAVVSRPPESRTGVASKAKAAPASKIRPSVLREATSRPASSSRAENPPKCSEAVLPSETPKTSAKRGKSETSDKTVHVKHSGGENADPRLHKSNQPAAPHLTTTTTDKKPPMKPTIISGDNTKQTNGIKIGLNQLILVACEGKKQIYCQLCSVKLTHSSDIHLTDQRHQLNYVKRCYPERNQNLDKVQNIIKNLAQMEKNLNVRKIQTIEVTQDVYDELRVLPQEKVFEKLKKIMGKGYAQTLSSLKAPPAETLKRDAAGASPCEVSSTNDGIFVPQSETSGLSTNNQPEQESKNKLQMPNAHTSEEACVAATRSDRTQSLDGEETQADDSIQDQHRPSLRSNVNRPEPNPGPSVQAEEKKAVIREKPVTDTSRETPDTRQQQKRSSAEIYAAQKMPKAVTRQKPVTDTSRETPDTRQQQRRSSAEIYAAQKMPEAVTRQKPVTDTSRETPDTRQQQRRSSAEIYAAQKMPEGTKKTSPVEIFRPDQLSPAAVTRQKPVTDTSQETPDTRQQQKRCSAEIYAAQKIPEGEKNGPCSLLSTYLNLKRLDTEPIIGLGFVWECQGISKKTFFLCESCSKMLSHTDICQHMISSDHKLQCFSTKFPETMRKLLPQDEITQQVLKDAILKLSRLERQHQIDAQVVLLGQEQYECIRRAPFSEALQMVRNIKFEKKESPFCLSTGTLPKKNQQPEDRPSPVESPPTEMKSAESPETNQGGDKAEVSLKEASKTPEKPPLDEPPVAEDVNVAKERSVSSPLDVKRSSSKADSVASPSPPASTDLSPQEACSSLSVKPEFTSPPPVPPVQVKLEELNSQTPCSAAPLPSKDDDAEPKSDQQKSWAALNALIALVKEGKKKKSCGKSAPDPEDVNSGVTNVSECKGENFDSTCVKTEFEASNSLTTTSTGCENHVAPQANSASSAIKSSSEDCVTRGSCLFGATEGKTAGTIVPAVTITDQPSFAATKNNPGQILQPQGDKKSNIPGVSLLPINTIITDRPAAARHKFVDSCKGENHWGQQVGLSPFQSTYPSDTMAASGGYGQSGHSVYFPSQPIPGYTTPHNPVVHTGALYQHQQYPIMQFYPSQLHPEQMVNPYSFQSFGNRIASPMPTGWGGLEMQQPHQQQLMQQQQLQQLMLQQQVQQLQLQVQQLQQQQQQLEKPEQQQVLQQQVLQQQIQQQVQQQQVQQPQVQQPQVQQQQVQQQQVQQQQVQQQQIQQQKLQKPEQQQVQHQQIQQHHVLQQQIQQHQVLQQQVQQQIQQHQVQQQQVQQQIQQQQVQQQIQQHQVQQQQVQQQIQQHQVQQQQVQQQIQQHQVQQQQVQHQVQQHQVQQQQVQQQVQQQIQQQQSFSWANTWGSSQ